ncbi:MAG: polysaccharide biosynthesis protein [Actinobacteria bacterium HGW-Actinobacteria-1]|nr:MAG: polysaccharide biosynthesis protein [Actinobacteria bacterium HGW-Actinobacteria-1]
MFEGKHVLVTGGTGSLGQVLTRRLLSGSEGVPESVTVFSRDEAKQHYMRLDFMQRRNATDEVIFENSRQALRFIIGDVRDYASVVRAAQNADIVFAAAALKQVPSCEYYPWEAVRTNIAGAENLVRAIAENRLPVETVVGISTDKACKPVNVMGMTKAIQERVYIDGNLRAPDTRFIAARYGNVLASRGSVVPLFLDQIAAGGPVTITTADMTRFLLTLEDAVDTIFAAVRSASPGETYIPKCPSAKMTDLARFLIGDKDIEMIITGIRPGEKIHEILLSEEEATRTIAGHEGYFALRPMLPELAGPVTEPALVGDYSSAGALMTPEALAKFLAEKIPEVVGESYLEA